MSNEVHVYAKTTKRFSFNTILDTALGHHMLYEWAGRKLVFVGRCPHTKKALFINSNDFTAHRLADEVRIRPLGVQVRVMLFAADATTSVWTTLNDALEDLR